MIRPSCGGSEPSRTPHGDVLGDDVGERTAELEPFGVDERVDRLGEQGISLPGSLQGALGERLEHGQDPLGGLVQPRRRRPDRLDLPRHDLPEHVHDQVGFGGEVAVHTADGHPGPLGDRGDGTAAVAALGQLARRGGDDRLALRVEAFLHLRGTAVGHVKK